MESGFVKADSGNLPKVDTIMLHLFYKNNPNFLSAEIKNVKSKRATREEYGDEAIGFVQVQRKNNICTVKAKVTPEHCVREKAYDVTAIVNEDDENIVSCECHGCIACSGGCKPTIAFLYWLYRRSEEPSCTSVKCYWRSSSLSKVGKSVKAMSLNEMFGGPLLPSKNPNILNNIISEGKANGGQSLLLHQFLEDGVTERTSIHNLTVNYCRAKQLLHETPNANDFVQFCKEHMSENDCKSVQIETEMQSKSTIWHELRYCRITASRLYETARCKTNHGSLIEKPFGATKIPETDEMTRGLCLEDRVLAVVRQKRHINIEKCGMVLRCHYPLFGASPDAVSKKYCIEVKCPSKEKTVQNYLSAEGKISNKFLAQIQLQMYMLKKTHGLFCVASPNFEKDKEVTIVEVEYDEDYCNDLMCKAEIFWKSAVFPKLIYT